MDSNLEKKLDGIFELSPLQQAVFDRACDICTYTEQELAQLIKDCKGMSAVECRQTLASLR